MKKLIKGFTLIELVVVMAIMSILMAAIIQMFKPVRETFVDSTMYESRRTTQNGVVKYISESIRYATDLGIYNYGDTKSAGGSISSTNDAIEEFAAKYCNANKSADPNDVKRIADVIVIDNMKDAYTFNQKPHTGRVLRRSTFGSTSVNDDFTDEGLRLALGAGYYGDADLAIKLSKPPETASMYPDLSGDDLVKELNDWSADEGIRITVASTVGYAQRNLQNGKKIDDSGFGTGIASTEGLVVCPNLTRGIFDITKDASTSSPGYTPPSPGGGGGTGGNGRGTSSKNNATSVNGVIGDDTVGSYQNPGTPSGGSGGSAVFVDKSEYKEENATWNTKVYIVFLRERP